MTRAELAAVDWRVSHADPVLHPPGGSPILADPTFLLPHDMPDGRWHLYAHSTWGLHHYTSADGMRWSRPRLAVRHAMRPYLFRDGGLYHLLYERYPAFRLPLSIVPSLRWRSWIERRSSADLARWSAPSVVLRPTLAWHRTLGLGEAVGNPTVLRDREGYRLYYSAGLVHVPDCGFNEPLHVGIARAESLVGPWRPDPQPILSPRDDDPRANLGAGALRVLRLADGFAGFQNGIAFDRATGRSSSALSLLLSADGRDWRYAHAKPVVAPTAGWRARYVYACDVRRDVDGRWYLYFNGRDQAAMLRGREAIGFVVGETVDAGRRLG